MSDWLRESLAHRLGLPPGEPLPPILTAPQVQKVTGLGRGTVYEAARTGELPAMKVRGRLIFPTAKLLELLGESSSQAPAGPPSPRPRPLIPGGAE